MLANVFWRCWYEIFKWFCRERLLSQEFGQLETVEMENGNDQILMYKVIPQGGH